MFQQKMEFILTPAGGWLQKAAGLAVVMPSPGWMGLC